MPHRPPEYTATSRPYSTHLRRPSRGGVGGWGGASRHNSDASPPPPATVVRTRHPLPRLQHRSTPRPRRPLLALPCATLRAAGLVRNRPFVLSRFLCAARDCDCRCVWRAIACATSIADARRRVKTARRTRRGVGAPLEQERHERSARRRLAVLFVRRKRRHHRLRATHPTRAPSPPSPRRIPSPRRRRFSPADPSPTPTPAWRPARRDTRWRRERRPRSSPRGTAAGGGILGPVIIYLLGWW